MEITRDHKVAVAQWLRKNSDLTIKEIAVILEVSDRTAGRMLTDFYDGKAGKVKSYFDTEKLRFLTGDEQVAKKGDATAKFQMVLTNKTITLIRNGKPATADKAHRHYEQIRKLCDKKQYAEAYDLINDKSGVKTFGGGKVEIFEGACIYNGVQINSDIGKKIVAMAAEGREDAAEAFSNFLVRVYSNPDDNMVERLFAFCQFNDIKIDKDGYVLTYKSVRGNYKDIHSGTFDNSPGVTVQIDRKKVDPNVDQTCSYGLHVCSIGYLTAFGYSSGGNRIVLCRVDPADFVAVPRDYGNRKARVCKYDVLADVTDNGLKILGKKEIEADDPIGLQLDRSAFMIEGEVRA